MGETFLDVRGGGLKISAGNKCKEMTKVVCKTGLKKKKNHAKIFRDMILSKGQAGLGMER